ncbi:MAG TPA: hypothetical protein VIU38_03565 [Anaerolineales bacterium]
MNVRIKELVGQFPAAAAVYEALRPRRPRTRYSLDQLAVRIPGAVHDARSVAPRVHPGKKVVLFATLHYWIEQAVMLGLTLRGLGHDVTIAYLPYSNWEKEINKFDLRRQDLYTHRVLRPLNGYLRAASLLDVPGSGPLPASLEEVTARASEYDVMYSLQTEEIDCESPLYKLRHARNQQACRSALAFLKQEQPDAAIIPNGLVTELGVFHETARYLQLPTVTYEFNDQREQIWLADDDTVMHQNTDALWSARGDIPLSNEELDQIKGFEAARQSARVYGKGTRLWQDAPSQGSGALRQMLGLDERPVVLLATNVLGDSLTLGRNIFAGSMAEWIRRTVRYFAERSDAQLVVRIHPGERLIKGPSMMRVIQQALPEKPDDIHVVGPAEPINTYDLMGLANLGLVYTTTVGMEMAMQGIPVVVAGNTHYRDRGFALAPRSWDEYFSMLDQELSARAPRRLSEYEIELAWRYGYRFFFEYPFDFPWRLMHFWKDFEEWPLARVLGDEGQRLYGTTFRYLAGEKINWSRHL